MQIVQPLFGMQLPAWEHREHLRGTQPDVPQSETYCPDFALSSKIAMLGPSRRTQPLSDPPTRVVMMVAIGRLFGSGDPDGLGLNALFEAFRSVLAADAALLVASEG